LKRAASLALLGVLALGACDRLSAQNSSRDETAFGERVRAYILSHPEVIQEAVEKLQAKQDADAEAAENKARALLPTVRTELERDPRDYVANPNGRITVTEFYDYRCPHCVNAAPKVLALIAANSDLRFVFKESPIFGATSQHAARAALAVRKAGGDYLGLYKSLMATHGLDEAAIDRIAMANGATQADLKDPNLGAKQLADISALFSRLDLGGTPAFIIGDDIIYGEDMDALNAAIAKARGGKG
jgi:protein-disulfide isomerase